MRLTRDVVRFVFARVYFIAVAHDVAAATEQATARLAAACGAPKLAMPSKMIVPLRHYSSAALPIFGSASPITLQRGPWSARR
jgi:hypothetical protein